jgi:hypothetical protein
VGETHPPRAIRQLVNEALAALDVEYGPTSIAFTWIGFDEMDEVSGEGNAELLDDGSIEIEFEYENGDEAVLKAT